MNERPPAPGPARRRLAQRVMLTIATFASAGMLLSLLIAAICAVWIPLAPQSQAAWPPPTPTPAQLDRLGALPDHWGDPLSITDRQRPGLLRRDVAGLLRPRISASGSFLATRIEAGFPARCLVARRLWDSEAGDLSAGPWRSGAVLGPAWRPWTHDPRRYNSILPLRPLAAGLAINTLTWGAPLWLIFRGSRLARRHWRLRRGRCPSCGYPRPEDPAPGPHPCPECGAEWPGP